MNLICFGQFNHKHRADSLRTDSREASNKAFAKAGFRVPQKHLCKVEVQFSE